MSTAIVLDSTVTPRLTLAVAPLARLAVQVADAHDAVNEAAFTALECGRRAGGWLIEAKAQLKHGEWLPWLEANFPNIAVRTLQGYMQLSREWARIEAAKARGPAHFTIQEALSLLAKPQEDASGNPAPPATGGPAGASQEEDSTDSIPATGSDDPVPDSQTRQLSLRYDITEWNEIRGLLRDLAPVFQTATETETALAAIRHAHAELAGSRSS